MAESPAPWSNRRSVLPERADDPRRSLSRRAIALWPYLVIAFLYCATWPFHHGLNNPNEMVRVYMTRSLARSSAWSIDEVIAEWGGVDDKAIRDGRLYSSKAPLQSLVGVPVHRWLTTSSMDKRAVTTTLRRVCNVLPGWVFACVVVAWARRRSRALAASDRLGTAVGLSLAAGSMLFPYSITFTGHIWAAISAGGAYLLAVALSRTNEGSLLWTCLAMALGFCAALAPFAEYPAALAAICAIGGAAWVTRGFLRRVWLCFLLGLGGAAPMALGLWAHEKLWGSPFKTGYAFLENHAYVSVHQSGFFGVGMPRIEALLGALFSPGTGLFFYSPILVLGLFGLVGAIAKRRTSRTVAIHLSELEPSKSDPIDWRLALAGLVGCFAEFAFLAGHSGWRGGWTLGPRYIIAVAPILGLGVVEALRWSWASAAVAVLGTLSILITGCSAALYPHLSDVYTNPIASFVWPSYREGFGTYGLGSELGLAGHLANSIHLLPLLMCVAYVACVNVEGTKGSFRGILRTGRNLLVIVLMVAGIFLIHERDPQAASAENARLWGFWEPTPKSSRTPRHTGMFLSRARDTWRSIRVDARSVADNTRVSICRPEPAERCQYGTEAWQHFGPDYLEMKGIREPILFMHPIAEQQVVATIPVPPGARHAVFRYGLADASVRSDNASPVQITLANGPSVLHTLEATNVLGLHELPIALTSTTPFSVSIAVARDGARVFGFDVEFFAGDSNGSVDPASTR